MPDTRGGGLAFIGCVEAGFFTASRLLGAGIRPAAILSIDPAMAAKNKVSGYKDLFALPSEDALRYRPRSYGLSDPGDVTFFREQAFDLLVVLGWQRLIPDPVLATLRSGGVTIHGSGPGLPKGRGRSPMNWAILEGYERFHLHLLTLGSGADTGRILDTIVFDIQSTDDIRTLYCKNAWAASEMMIRSIPALLRGELRGEPQDEAQATIYPKRTPEDGRIDWTRPAEEIERLVRATTRPYPGAFTGNDRVFLRIWAAQLFDRRLRVLGAPGAVAAVFSDNAFVVRTGTFPILVTEYEGPVPSEGALLR